MYSYVAAGSPHPRIWVVGAGVSVKALREATRGSSAAASVLLLNRPRVQQCMQHPCRCWKHLLHKQWRAYHLTTPFNPCLQASLANLRVPDYIAEDPLIKAMGVTKDQVVAALKNVGFTDDLLVSAVVVCVLRGGGAVLSGPCSHQPFATHVQCQRS